MKGYILTVWDMVDPLYYACSRLKYIPGDKTNIFRVRLTKYKGRSIVLSDGTSIKKNDLLLKIHLHNVRVLRELQDIKSELRKAKTLYRHVQNSLPGLDVYIREHFQAYDVKGIIGITWLNKGYERLGFEIIDIVNPYYKWFKTISFLPIGYLSHSEMTMIQMVKTQRPSYLFMSREKLRKMYR